MEEALARLQAMVDSSQEIVFFGGAGVSTESGIPDFRSPSGLYHQEYAYPPETILSHRFYKTQPEEFFRFYCARVLHLDAQPNAAHYALAALEKAGRLRAVITQNIDGLHQKAGSREVLELHGSVWRNYCERCGKPHTVDFVQAAAGLPRCACGGKVRPDVVLYEEGLNQDTMQRAVAHLRKADMLLIGGTSLAVYPAAGLIDYFSGPHLAVINKGELGHKTGAGLTINAAIGQVLGQLALPGGAAGQEENSNSRA